MKYLIIFCFSILFSVSVSGQGTRQDKSDSREPKEKRETSKDCDSLYTWHWSGTEEFNEEFLEKFQKSFDRFREDREGFGDEFMSGFYLDEEMAENFRDMQRDFELKFMDSVFLDDHIMKFFDDKTIKLHGFNFDGENFEEMPFDKEKMEELQKRMRDLLDGEYDERIKEFIEKHKSEIDDIRYQIRESIPDRRKAI